MGTPQAARPKMPPPTRRMSLAKVIKGKIEAPVRALVYGSEGIGKSSWAAGAPSPIFVAPEAGTDNLDVERLCPDDWQDIKDAISELISVDHKYRTLVIDTLDAAEPWLWDFICQRDKKSSIEDYGYGKGYTAAIDEWRVFLSLLEQLRQSKGMNVILIAHSYIKTFKNPEAEDFDRYELKLNAKAGGLIKEWCDAVLFAHYETFSVKDERKGTIKGVSTGARIVSTTRTAAWDAKNRYSLPPTLPLDYEDFANAVTAHRPADPETLKVSITNKLAEIGDRILAEKVSALVLEAGNDAVKLSKFDNRLSVILNEKKGA